MKGYVMKIQTLVATMEQKNYSLLDTMNIQTEAIICNQCEYNKIDSFDYKGNKILWFSFAERGVGLNRNNALMRSDADVAVFADDDMIYVEKYPEIVSKAFEELPDADVIIFDLKYPHEQRKPITKIQRLSKKDCMRFGAARLAVRIPRIHLNGISFNLCFGGGAKYSSGEDTLFLNDCLNKKMKIYAYPAIIAHLQDQRESTWFQGYNDKYFFDKGIIYYLLNKKISGMLSFYHCIKHYKKYKSYGWIAAWKQMKKGIEYARTH